MLVTDTHMRTHTDAGKNINMPYKAGKNKLQCIQRRHKEKESSKHLDGILQRGLNVGEKGKLGWTKGRYVGKKIQLYP